MVHKPPVISALMLYKKNYNTGMSICCHIFWYMLFQAIDALYIQYMYFNVSARLLPHGKPMVSSDASACPTKANPLTYG